MSRNFGVEIECINITERRAVEVLVAAGVNVSTNTNYRHEGYTQWKVIHDSSIQGSLGCEVVSPILNGDAGLEDIKKVCKALSDAGATVNKSCGLHVHVDATGLTGEWIRNIVKRYNKFENTIDSFMPVSRRARNNSRYCDSVSTMLSYMETSYARQWNADSAATVCSAATNRFHKINLTCFPRYNTIEFRHHSGSVNGSKITNWVNFVIAFVEASKPESVLSPFASNLPVQARRRGRPSRATIARTSAALPPDAPVVVANVFNLSSYSQRKVYQVLSTNVGNWVTKTIIAETTGIDIDSVASYISTIRACLGVEILNRRNWGYRLVSLNVVNTTRAPVTAAVRQQALAPVMVNDEWTRGIPAHIVSYYIERASDLNA